MVINEDEIKNFIGKHSSYFFSFDPISEDIFFLSYTYNSFTEIEITNKHVIIVHESEWDYIPVSSTLEGLNNDEFFNISLKYDIPVVVKKENIKQLKLIIKNSAQEKIKVIQESISKFNP